MKPTKPAVLLALALLAASTVVTAQSRTVILNGQRLTDAQIAELARRNCADIPNGAYWMNMQTGAWGYAGNPQVQGTFGDSCNGGGGGGGAGVYGPFATRDRAQQVTNQAIANGYSAHWYHAGEGFWVSVRR